MKDFLVHALCGFIAGVPGGMGLGGGTVLIPILTIFCDAKQHVAQAANLVSFIPMAIIASILHFKNGYIKKEGLLAVIIPAVLLAVVTGLVSKQIDDDVLKKIFGGFLIIVAAFSFFADKINSKR